jgi:hypothetical protein
MKLILWIDEKELNLKLFDKIFQNQGHKFYGLNSVLDFSYLIKDLSPSVIVIDSKTVIKNLDRFTAQFVETNEFEGVPLVVIDHVPELNFLGSRYLNLTTPLNPFELPSKIEAYLKSS